MKTSGFLLALLFASTLQFLSAQPKHEFRAAWIATVGNIDWPSRGNIDPASQQAEFINLLNLHQRNGLNAVIVQVRPATDAFYPSPFEPWSEWLTGKQGRPPVPYYDPLQFMIDETHKRGMEFHAWCNPYRATFNVRTSIMSATHVTRLHPEWFLVYGNTRYFDPGNKEVQQYVKMVIADLVRRYDLDAVHFDDYFYPYRLPGREFPDDNSFSRYNNGLSRADWRRSNVDSIIVSLNRVIKAENKYCKFGVSPFGVWRNQDVDPEGSLSRAGQTNYDDLYADILLWLRNGWVDYVTPQLYWELGHRLVAYETLIDWWSKHGFGRHMYIGHGIYKALEPREPAWRKPAELPSQLTLLRNYPTIQGSAYYNTRSFLRNPNGWNDSLRQNFYQFPAIVPPMPWIDSLAPTRPTTEKIAGGGWRVTAASGSRARYFLLYAGSGRKPSAIRALIPETKGSASINREQLRGCNDSCFVTLVDRNNLESDPVLLR